MLLDLWEWFLLINDGIDLVFSNLASGTYPIPLSFLLAFFLFGLISLFAWRSTDIPNLPPAPRPPYIIQITAGPGSGGIRQTIADVRLLSGGTFFDGSEILTRYQNISRNQATNTDSNIQPSTPGTSANRNVGTRGSLIDTSVTGQNIRRRIPGRSLLLGLFRRPNALTRPVPAVSNAIRAQLGSPNLVVYHRVNVYHHHIHSHLGHNNTNLPPNNIPAPSTSSSQNENSTASGISSSTSSFVPPPQSSSIVNSATSSLLPDSSSMPETSLPQNHERVVQSLNDTIDNVEHVSVDNGDTTVNDRGSFSTVHNQTEVPVDRALNSSNMPARSGGEPSQQSGESGFRDTTAYSHNTPPNANESPSESDVRFTIKFLNDTQMDVTSQLGEKIADFKRRHFATEMSENKTVRLIFNGRVLDNDNKTLREFGIFDQCVVHCLIVNRQQNEDQSHNAGQAAARNNGGPTDGVQGNLRRVVGLPEPGMFFVAFIGIFLIFLWFICLHFGQHLFTQSAVVSLTVLTAIFLIGIVACYLPLPTN